MLPYDIARCPGTTAPLCQTCRRREPGRDTCQVTIMPAVSATPTNPGWCPNKIEYDTTLAQETQSDE